MENALQNNNSAVKARSLWADAWRRFKKNKMAVISLIFLLLLALIGIATLIIDWVTNDSVYALSRLVAATFWDWMSLDETFCSVSYGEPDILCL